MIKVLALDLEGTLVSNAMSQIPRPGLYKFLSEVKHMFPRIVIFTAVKEDKFREIANMLGNEGSVPKWFATIDYIEWSGKKNLNLIEGVRQNEVILVDDYPGYIEPGQEGQWIPIKCFESPYADDDIELKEIMQALKKYLQIRCSNSPIA